MDRRTVALACAVMLSWTGSSVAAVPPGRDLGPLPAPPIATATSPSDPLLIGDVPASRVVMQWSQLPPTKPGAGAGIPTASFHLCFWTVGEPHDCRTRTGTRAVIDVPPDAVTRTVVDPLSVWERITRKRVPRVDFVFTASLPETLLYQPLEWAVLACGKPPKQGCSVGPSRQLGLSALDLAVTAIDKAFDNDHGIQPIVMVRNDGRTQERPFVVDVWVWEVLYDASTRKAVKRLDHPDVRDSDLVITAQGRQIRRDEYLRDNLPADEVKGVFRPGWSSAHWTRTVPEMPTGVEPPAPLQPGSCAEGQPCPSLAVGVVPCHVRDQCWLKPTQTERPIAFVMWAAVEPGSRWDLDPADNSELEGNVVWR